ncbi:MAG: hypothetical protein IAF94_17910 [Pirellulaceae bacterium]|nr:hypothetical protein [Pirellulaceae bacterium]
MDKIPPSFQRSKLEAALDRLIELAKAAEKPADAERWLKEKMELPSP